MQESLRRVIVADLFESLYVVHSAGFVIYKHTRNKKSFIVYYAVCKIKVEFSALCGYSVYLYAKLFKLFGAVFDGRVLRIRNHHIIEIFGVKLICAENCGVARLGSA